jgi:Uma2 family endonuclease
MATAKTAIREQRLRLSQMDWPAYVLWSDWMTPRRLRITYSCGELEAMTLSSKHEGSKKLLAQMVEVLTEELGIERASKGSMTFQREDLRKGIEPDECWWIANEPLVRGRQNINPLTDPPPDLVLEIEISRSMLNRMAIWAALRVPEVWRYDGKTVSFWGLTRAGVYEELSHSLALPFLRAKELQRFLRQSRTMGEVQLLRGFRKGVREQEKKGWRR